MNWVSTLVSILSCGATGWQQLHDFQVGVLLRPGEEAAASGGVTGGREATGGVTGGGAASRGVTGGWEASGGVTGGGAASRGVTGGEWESHPLPAWLSEDSPYFWKRYGKGVTESTLAYLSRAGGAHHLSRPHWPTRHLSRPHWPPGHMSPPPLADPATCHAPTGVPDLGLGVIWNRHSTAVVFRRTESAGPASV